MKENKLFPKVLYKLVKDTGYKEGVVRARISQIQTLHKPVTPNGAAQIFAETNRRRKTTVYGLIKENDKLSIAKSSYVTGGFKPSQSISYKNKRVAHNTQKSLLKEVFKFKSKNSFVSGHILELNKCYGAEAFTACFMLARKIFEGLLIDVLKDVCPPINKENKALYWNFGQHRYHDFSIILDNFKENVLLLDEKEPVGKKLIGHLGNFKEKGNLKTHYLIHLVKRKKEVDDLDIQDILDLFTELN